MSEIKKGSFRFESYRIKKVFFAHHDGEDEKLLFDFEPQGVYTEKSNLFFITLGFKAKDKTNQNEIIDILLEASFIFQQETKFEDIPDYFYKNSIAIIFPYIRAFISTLTLQTNDKILMLPVMNLSSLEAIFREKTTYIAE